MKGLLLKELYTMFLSYRRNLLLVGGIYSMVAVIGQMPSMFGALTIILGLYALATLTFDELCKWDTFCRTLPVTPGQVVAAKYLSGFCFLAVGSCFSALLMLVCCLIHPADASLAENLAAIGACLVVALLYTAVSLPVSYLVGPNKARFVVMAFAALVALLAVLAADSTLFSALVAGLPEISDLQAAAALLIVLGVSLLLYALSAVVSVQIYRRKDF